MSFRIAKQIKTFSARKARIENQQNHQWLNHYLGKNTKTVRLGFSNAPPSKYTSEVVNYIIDPSSYQSRQQELES